MPTDPLDALADVDMTWAVTVLAVQTAASKSAITKAKALAALQMSEADYDIWRRRFTAFGREMAGRLVRADQAREGEA